MLPDPLDIIWRVADNPTAIFATEDLVAMPSEIIPRLTKLGVLRQARTATHVTCDACWDHHVEKVAPITYPNGHTRFFITCPENGRVEVPLERLLQWAVDYMPLLQALASALSARDAPTELVPGRVWNVGRAALVGKSKPIWAARGLAWPDAAQVALTLPKGRSPVLFFLGQPADDGLLAIPRESIIELRTVVSLEDGLCIDRDAIERQLADAAELPPKKQTRKRSQRDATVGSLKRELHARILSMKSAIRHADDTDVPFQLPRLLQKHLAAAIKVSESSVSRAIAESDDPWLKILLQTSEDADMIRKYSRRG